MVNYKTIFFFHSFEDFLIEWKLLNDRYDVIFKKFMEAFVLTDELKTEAAISYEKIKYLNKHGALVFRKEIEDNPIVTQKLRL